VRASLDTVAKALGMSTADLRSALATGESIADVAKTRNVDINTVIDALVNDATSKIDDAVKANELTPDQATEMKSKLRDKITKAVNKTRSDGGGRFGRGKRPGMHGFGRGPVGGSSPVIAMPSL
jgi:ribosomal protein S20